MRRLRWGRVFAALAIVGGISGFGVTAVHDRPFPEAPPHARVPPKLDALPKPKACWLELLRNEAPGLAGTAGFTRARMWHVTVSGLLIRHPRGDVLIDAGNSSHFHDEVADYPLLPKLWLELLPGSNKRVALPADALRSVGVNPDTLTWLILSHGHVDHAGGIVDLPKAPVLAAQEELDFMKSLANDHTIDVIPAHARALEGRATPIHFEHVSYETFDESADLFGDGSIVVVKLPGHTPGSIGIFVNLSPTKRLFHVGDSINLVEQLDRRVGKSFVMHATDHDVGSAAEVVSKLAQLHALDPALEILPAHDRDAWQAAFGGEPRCIED